MTDERFARCPSCAEIVEPNGFGVHYAVPVQRIDTFGGAHYTEGIGEFLHRDCPVPDGWHAKPKP